MYLSWKNSLNLHPHLRALNYDFKTQYSYIDMDGSGCDEITETKTLPKDISEYAWTTPCYTEQDLLNVFCLMGELQNIKTKYFEGLVISIREEGRTIFESDFISLIENGEEVEFSDCENYIDSLYLCLLYLINKKLNYSD